MNFGLEFLSTAPVVMVVTFWWMMLVSLIIAIGAGHKNVWLGCVVGVVLGTFWPLFFNNL